MPTFDAGPYGFYVWSSYGLSALVIVWLVVDTLVRARRWRAKAGEGETRR